jgi:hypothetical protein
MVLDAIAAKDTEREAPDVSGASRFSNCRDPLRIDANH